MRYHWTLCHNLLVLFVLMFCFVCSFFAFSSTTVLVQKDSNLLGLIKFVVITCIIVASGQENSCEGLILNRVLLYYTGP